MSRPLIAGVAGFVTEKFVASTLTPMVGATFTGSAVTRIAFKLGMAYVSAWFLEMLGMDFTAAFIGGSADAAQDFTSTFLAGTIPGISGMGVYSSNLPMRRLSGVGVYSQGRAMSHDMAS